MSRFGQLSGGGSHYSPSHLLPELGHFEINLIALVQITHESGFKEGAVDDHEDRVSREKQDDDTCCVF